MSLCNPCIKLFNKIYQVPTQPRPRRSKRVKFVGRNIQHEWIVDEDSGKTEWYTGRVLQVIKGIMQRL